MRKTSFYKNFLTPKNVKEILKIVYLWLNPSEKILEINTNQLNKYFNETAKHSIATNTQQRWNQMSDKLISEHSGSRYKLDKQIIQWSCKTPNCNQHTKDEPESLIKSFPKSLIKSFPVKNNEFQLHTVSYDCTRNV